MHLRRGENCGAEEQCSFVTICSVLAAARSVPRQSSGFGCELSGQTARPCTCQKSLELATGAANIRVTNPHRGGKDFGLVWFLKDLVNW